MNILLNKIINNYNKRVNSFRDRDAKIICLILAILLVTVIIKNNSNLIRFQFVSNKNYNLAIFELLNQTYLSALIKYLGIFTVILSPLFLVGLYNGVIRFLFFIIISIVLLLEYEIGPGHIPHFYFWAFLPFGFLFEFKNWKDALFFSQLFISLLYFYSGISKLINIPGFLIDSNIVPYWNSLIYLIADEFILSNFKRHIFVFLYENNLLSSIALIIVLILQLSSPFIVMMTNKSFILGICLIFFHVISYFVLGPNFLNVTLVIFSIFVLPKILEKV